MQEASAQSAGSPESERCEYCECNKLRCKTLERRLALLEGSGHTDLDAISENAVYKDRAEQLQQQLEKAEAEAVAVKAQNQSLWVEKGRFQGHCQQLKRQLKKATSRAACLREELIAHTDSYSDASWLVLSEARSTQTDLLTESSRWLSLDASSPRCFTVDSTFTTESGALVAARDLTEGSKILATDGSVVAVSNARPLATLLVGPPPQQMLAGSESVCIILH